MTRRPPPPTRLRAVTARLLAADAAIGTAAVLALLAHYGTQAAPDATAAGIQLEPMPDLPDYADEPTLTTERNTTWPTHDTAADANGPEQPRHTASPAADTSAPSPDSTATAPPVSVQTPQESPREQVGTFSGAPLAPSGTPGSSQPTGSTLSTQPSLQPSATTPPSTTTATAATTTTAPTTSSTPTTTTPTSPATTEETEPVPDVLPTISEEGP